MKVKICGLTNLADCLAAVNAGADLLGFNFYPPSPRCISPGECARIVRELRTRKVQVVTVGVFVNSPADEILKIMDSCHLDLAQLSGDEPRAVLAAVGPRAYKALRPANTAALQEGLASYSPRSAPPAWLVDAHHPGQYGGTGQIAEWNLARSLARKAPILLAGGLNPSNVAQAVRQVQPWGVDVASGVELSPGYKDDAKMRAFVDEVRKSES